MESRVVWRGLDAYRSEYADVRIDGGRLFARGAQIGIEPEPYLLRYRLEPGRVALEIEGGRSLELELGEHDAFDLAFSPLFNSIPVLRDGLHEGGDARDYLMAFVSVPELTVEESRQRYEPLGPGGLIRFRSDDFVADLDFDEDGLVRSYEGLAERIA